MDGGLKEKKGERKKHRRIFSFQEVSFGASHPRRNFLALGRNKLVVDVAVHDEK